MDGSSWIRSVFSAVASFAIAILSGLGVGSGGLFVIWLTMVEGLDSISARGYNLLFFVFSASAALVFHALRKRLRVRLVIFMSLFACIGTAIGVFLSQRIGADLLRKFFGVLLMVSGGYTLIARLPALANKSKQKDASIDPSKRRFLHSNDKNV